MTQFFLDELMISIKSGRKSFATPWYEYPPDNDKTFSSRYANGIARITANNRYPMISYFTVVKKFDSAKRKRTLLHRSFNAATMIPTAANNAETKAIYHVVYIIRMINAIDK